MVSGTKLPEKAGKEFETEDQFYPQFLNRAGVKEILPQRSKDAKEREERLLGITVSFFIPSSSTGRERKRFYRKEARALRNAKRVCYPEPFP